MFSLPFSLRPELLTAMPMICAAVGCEEDVELEWSPVDAPLTQHWADIGHDPDADPQWYPLWEVRPVGHAETSDGRVAVYRTGMKRQPGDPD